MPDQNTNLGGGDIGTPSNPSEQLNNQPNTPDVQTPDVKNVTMTQTELNNLINGKFAQGAKSAKKDYESNADYQNYLNNKDKFSEFIETNNKNISPEELRTQLETKHQEEMKVEREKITGFSSEMKDTKLETILTGLNVRVDKDDNGKIVQDYRKVLIGMIGDKIQYDLTKRTLVVNDENDLISTPNEYIQKFVNNYSAFLNPALKPGLGKDGKSKFNNLKPTEMKKGDEQSIFNSLKNKLK